MTEVLTEGYLIEEGLDIEMVRRILHRRDRFLRELVYSQRLAAPLVAELLKDSVSSKAELEDAVGRGLSTLGFEVSPMGGDGKLQMASLSQAWESEISVLVVVITPLPMMQRARESRPSKLKTSISLGLLGIASKKKRRFRS